MRLCDQAQPNDAHLANEVNKKELHQPNQSHKNPKNLQRTEFQHSMVSRVEIFDFTT